MGDEWNNRATRPPGGKQRHLINIFYDYICLPLTGVAVEPRLALDRRNCIPPTRKNETSSIKADFGAPAQPLTIARTSCPRSARRKDLMQVEFSPSCLGVLNILPIEQQNSQRTVKRNSRVHGRDSSVSLKTASSTPFHESWTVFTPIHSRQLYRFMNSHFAGTSLNQCNSAIPMRKIFLSIAPSRSILQCEACWAIN